MILLLILAFIVLALAGPVCTIWSLNLLFGFAIPVTFKTYLASMWLGMIVSGAGAVALKSRSS